MKKFQKKRIDDDSIIMHSPVWIERWPCPSLSFCFVCCFWFYVGWVGLVGLVGFFGFGWVGLVVWEDVILPGIINVVSMDGDVS